MRFLSRVRRRHVASCRFHFSCARYPTRHGTSSASLSYSSAYFGVEKKKFRDFAGEEKSEERNLCRAVVSSRREIVTEAAPRKTRIVSGLDAI